MDGWDGNDNYGKLRVEAPQQIMLPPDQLHENDALNFNQFELQRGTSFNSTGLQDLLNWVETFPEENPSTSNLNQAQAPPEQNIGLDNIPTPFTNQTVEEIWQAINTQKEAPQRLPMPNPSTNYNNTNINISHQQLPMPSPRTNSSSSITIGHQRLPMPNLDINRNITIGHQQLQMPYLGINNSSCSITSGHQQLPVPNLNTNNNFTVGRQQLLVPTLGVNNNSNITISHRLTQPVVVPEMTLEDYLVEAGVVKSQFSYEQKMNRAHQSQYGNVQFQSAGNNFQLEANMNMATQPMMMYNFSAQPSRIQNPMVGNASAAAAPMYPLTMLNPTGGMVGNFSSSVTNGPRIQAAASSSGSQSPRPASIADIQKLEERREKRMIKNRESAARSRARKLAYSSELETEVEELEKQNLLLHNELNKLRLKRKLQKEAKDKSQARKVHKATQNFTPLRRTWSI